MLNENKDNIILKVLVGSKAHGLADTQSDRDFRGVFVRPTRDILKLRAETEDIKWMEGCTDTAFYEIKKFLELSVRCVPAIMEVFFAPVVFENDYGSRLRSIAGSIWNPDAVKNSFINYGRNQRKKFLDNKDGQADKYAAAQLRVLYNGYQLLSTGERFDVNLEGSPVFEKVKRFKKGEYSIGEVVQECWEWECRLLDAYRSCPPKKTNYDAVDDLLISIRKDFL